MLSWAQVAALVSVLASFRGLRGRLRAMHASESPPWMARVLLIRPCAGHEPTLERALSSSRVLASVAPEARVVLAVASFQDNAFPVAVRVQQLLAIEGLAASVQETQATTPNAKSGQLAAVLTQEAADVILVADSDVELGEAELRGLLRTLSCPKVSAAWVPPAEVGPCKTWGDRASQALLGSSLHAFPVLSGIDRAGMVGKLFAVKRTALEAVGGFEALTDVLGEDMELARRLAGRGFRVEVVPLLARSLAVGRSVGAAVERYTRWLQVIRAQRPALLLTYPLLFFPTLPLLLLSVAAPLHPWVAWTTAVLALAGRLWVAMVARILVDRSAPRGGLGVDVMLADLLLMASFVRALSRRTVEWRGRTLAITPRGRLVARTIGAALPVLLAVWLSVTSALALPAVGEMGKNVDLEDADGKVIKLETLVGKPILIVYEDKDSTKMNQSFKDELSKLAKGDKYKDKVALAAVADLTAYNYWPIKGFVKDSIREESKKLGTTIFCDWTGHVQVSYAFRKKTSSVVLLNKQGRVIFASEGKMSAEQRKQVIDLLRAEVEGK
ncbi:MAG: glycosyltransferase [Polyangiaceae bacterium]|nr:glycosyltransferase [Polyangiaceae bacterium]